MIWALMGLFLLALVGAAAVLVWSTRKNALDGGQEQVTRFIAGAEAALNRTFLSVDVLLASTDDLLALSSTVAERIQAPQASALLRNTMQQNLIVRSVALLDERGQVLASSGQAGARLPLHLPDGFVAQVLAAPVPVLVVRGSADSA